MGPDGTIATLWDKYDTQIVGLTAVLSFLVQVLDEARISFVAIGLGVAIPVVLWGVSRMRRGQSVTTGEEPSRKDAVIQPNSRIQKVGAVLLAVVGFMMIIALNAAGVTGRLPITPPQYLGFVLGGLTGLLAVDAGSSLLSRVHQPE